MRFQLKTFLSSIALLLATVKSDDVNLFTSDGVVYSYAVVTSTIAPPSVRVETHYYTTTRVREVTLDNSEVETTTEKLSLPLKLLQPLKVVLLLRQRMKLLPAQPQHPQHLFLHHRPLKLLNRDLS